MQNNKIIIKVKKQKKKKTKRKILVIKKKEFESETKNMIVGVECYKCKKEPFGAYNKKDWWGHLHQKCGYCGEENAIRWRWNV